jgi:hypothetical protein
VLLPLLCGTKSDFLNFPGEVTPALRDKTAKLAKSSEMTVKKTNKKQFKRMQPLSSWHPPTS